jgi:hypothetical protein
MGLFCTHARGAMKEETPAGAVYPAGGGAGFQGWRFYYYARNAEIRASAQGRAPAAIVCQTLDEFIVKSNGCETLAAA